MEPRKPEQEHTPQARTREKKRRFRLVKLEERIAPSKGGRFATDVMHCGTNSGTYNTCSM